MATWARDFKLAARSLTRAPMFTLVIVVTLTLAIGANTAIFSVVKPVLLEPLPYPNADRLVHIAGYAPGTDQPELGVPDEVYFEWRASILAIEDGGLYATGMTTTRVEGRVEQQFGTRATASFFTTLGARVLHGRLPTEEDGSDVVVLSHWMWESWFGSNPDVVGRSYTFARGTRTVIGVMVPEFRFPDERVAYWSPWPLRASQVSPGGFGANMIARIAPGTDSEELVAQLAPVPRRVQERLGGSASYAEIMQRYGAVVTPLREHLVGKVSAPLWILLGTVGIVFLVACANLANLFMVRAESRRRDFAVRRAHGAGRADLVRLQMAEALVLAGTGGAGGILLAWACVPLLIRAAPDAVAGGIQSTPIPGLESAGLDITALLFTGAMCVLAACAFGLLPAIRFSSGQLGSLRQAGSVGRSTFTREALVVLQTASALALLVGSALLVRSFWKLSRVDPGYDTRGILTFQIAPDRANLRDRAAVAQFQYAFMDRLAALRGVQSVGYINVLPLDEAADADVVTSARIKASGAEPPLVHVAAAGGAYFQTMGIELLRGRFFDRIEEQKAATNVIISRTAAELLFPGEDPLGQQVLPPKDDDNQTGYTVIGVVEDVVLADFRRESPQPTVYVPGVSLSPAYVVKSARADQLVPEVRAVIREVIPESPMYRVFTMEQLAANTMASLSFTMLMLSIGAVLALIIGAVGIYGVLSYSVAQRTCEIAVRMAMGAEPAALRRMIVLQGGRVALIGVALGSLIAFGVTHFLESLLFGVRAIDALAFLAMSSVMLAVALLASYVPARRASAVDPMRSLRT